MLKGRELLTRGVRLSHSLGAHLEPPNACGDTTPTSRGGKQHPAKNATLKIIGGPRGEERGEAMHWVSSSKDEKLEILNNGDGCPRFHCLDKGQRLANLR